MYRTRNVREETNDREDESRFKGKIKWNSFACE